MKPKQLTPEQLAERSARVTALPNTRPLSTAPSEATRFYTHLTDVKLRSIKEPEWGIYIAESSKVIRRARRRAPASLLSHERKMGRRPY